MTSHLPLQPICILISGTGSNMMKLVLAAEQRDWWTRFGAKVVAVISNQPKAKGLQWAKNHGLETHIVPHYNYTNREAFDRDLAGVVDGYGKPLVLLAGFMRILSPWFVSHYQGRLLNIHPSLLPAFTGLHTHERAIQAGCQFAGATVHWVTEALDGGPILEQVIVPILPEDDADRLAQRVLTQEHLLYPRAVEKVLGGLHHGI